MLSGQLIRSGTSIGANGEEAIPAQRKRDFLAKMSIAMKEARTTLFLVTDHPRIRPGEQSGNHHVASEVPGAYESPQQDHVDDPSKPAVE